MNPLLNATERLLVKAAEGLIVRMLNGKSSTAAFQ